MAQTHRSYLIAPNLTFLPDGPLALGNVVADPLKPHRPLTTLKREQWPPTAEAVETSRRVVRENSADVHGGFKADVSVVLPASGHASARRQNSSTREFNFKALHTTYFTADPPSEDMDTVLANSLVRYAMGNPYWGKPIYIVNGIKIAKGLVTKESAKSTVAAAVGVGAGAGVVPGLSLGADAGFDSRTQEEDSGESGQDVVLAYQLLRVARKGWRCRRLEIDEYKPGAALLADGGNVPEGENKEIESEVVTDLDVATLDDVDDDMPVFFLDVA